MPAPPPPPPPPPRSRVSAEKLPLPLPNFGAVAGESTVPDPVAPPPAPRASGIFAPPPPPAPRKTMSGEQPAPIAGASMPSSAPGEAAPPPAGPPPGEAWMDMYAPQPRKRTSASSADISTVVPPPSSATHAPPTFPAPVPAEAAVPPTPEEAEEARRDKKRMMIAVGGGALLLVCVAFLGASFVKSMFTEVTKEPPKDGLLNLTLYSQTRQRMVLLGLALNNYYETSNNLELNKGMLSRYGAVPELYNDKWGTAIQLRDTKLWSAGEDMKFDSPDDMWLDVFSMEVGGYFPSTEKAEAVLRNMPGGAEAAAQMKMMRLQAEQQQRRIQQAEQMVEQMESGGQPLAPPER